MAFSGIKDKIFGLFSNLIGLPAKLGTKFSRFAADLGGGVGSFTKKVRPSAGKASPLKKKFLAFFNLNRFSGDKRRTLLFGLGGLGMLVLILLITILALNSGKSKKNPALDLASGPVVAPEDLFIPTEPDFLPEYLLERNPRRFWSLEDIRLYWKNPGNPARWRDEVTKAVDKLMEGVP